MDLGLACFSIPHGLGPGGHWAWPQPFPLLFLRQTAPGVDTASCESSGGLPPQTRRLGGTGERGLESTLDHACWDASVLGLLMGPGDIYQGWRKGGIGGDERGVGAKT